jgi:hypothetical protein
MRSGLAALTLVVLAPAGFGQASAYEATFGSGGYEAGSQSALALQVPLFFSLREREGHQDWGLRFRVPIGLTVAEVEDDPLASFEDVLALSVVPTGEVELPIDETWTLIPYIGVGVLRDFESDLTQWLGQSGVKLRADTSWSETHLAFATALRYGAEIGSDGLGFDDFGRTEFGADLFQRTRARVRGHHLTPGVYGRAFFYWDDVTFERDSSTFTIDDEYEIGLSLGTMPDVEIFGFGLPRTYIGYRFGGGLRGVRISFGEIL